MNHTPEKLLALGFEIEGLLILAERRDDRTPAGVLDLLVEKTDELARGVKEFTASRLNEIATTGIEPTEATATVARAESVDMEIADNLLREEEADACVPAEEPVDIPDEAQPKVEEVKEVETVVLEPKPEPAVAEPKPQPVVVEPKPEPAVAEPKLVSKATEPVKLTLNDKFRFRRSLFKGSDAEMQDALATIATLSDMNEITDYLCNDLCLDAEDPEVIDFLEVIENNRK